jgi:alpha-1,6-mannosyltransferase
MKICDIVQAYTEKSGGIRTYIKAKLDFIRGRSELEHVLIVPGEKDSIRREGNLTTCTIKGWPVPGAHPYRFMLRSDKVLAILRDQKPHIIELGSGYWLPWTAFQYREERTCAVVGYYHTDYPTAYVEKPMGKVVGARLGKVLGHTARRYAAEIYGRCDATIVATELFREELRRMGVSNSHFIPLGVDLDTFHPENADRSLWREFGLDPEQTILLYSGRLDAEKRVLDLVEAVRIKPPENRPALVVVGSGPLRGQLEAMARDLPWLRVLPYITDRRELARVFASADVYVTAGPHETFGLSVLEAQASGLATVGVSAGALIERIPPEVGYRALPGCPRQLSRALSACLNDDLTMLGIRARRWAEKNFSWRLCMNRTINTYDEVLASHLGNRLPADAGRLVAGF